MSLPIGFHHDVLFVCIMKPKNIVNSIDLLHAGGSRLSQIFWEHGNLSGLSNYYNKFNYTKKFGNKNLS